MTIAVGPKRERRTFAEMNMVDCRTGNPNRQWKLLEQLARNNGRPSWQTPGASSRLKKQVQLLAGHLLRVFDILSWPFHDYQKSVGWRIELNLEAPR